MSKDLAANRDNDSEFDLVASLSIDAPAAARIAAVLSLYRQETGITLPASPSPHELRAVRNWLVSKETSDTPVASPLLWTRAQLLTPVVQPDLASKARWLQQASCRTCIPADVTPYSINFSIRVKPFSAQSSRPILARLKAAIAEYLRRKTVRQEAWTGLNLCVTIVAILPRADHLKDIDNLIKGLLDAMQGTIYENDRLIQHLSVHRLTHDGPDGWYKVRVMPVADVDEDVIDPSINVGWAGQPEIVIEPGGAVQPSLRRQGQS